MTAQSALRSVGIGAATGLRTMTGPASAFSATSGNWRWLLRAAALGEYVVDKLPSTPSRTQPFGLAARAVAGGLAGASVAPEARRTGAVLGIAGAMAAAYLGAAYRRETARRNFPPIPSALFEDAVAIALARYVVPHKPR
jgi:uncharacterized membrane protein